MSKKIAAGLIVGILAISGFMGFYFLPQLTKTNGLDPASAAILLIPQVPAQKWALIVCSDSSFPNEMTPSGWSDEGDFTGGPGDFSFFQVIAQSIGWWDSTKTCTIHPGPLGCLNITNTAPASGHWKTYNFIVPGSGGKVFNILNPNNYISINACISTINANGQNTSWYTGFPGFLNPPPGSGAFFGIIWLNGTNPLSTSTQAIGATWSRNYTGTTPWTSDSLMALPVNDAPSGAVGFAIALVLDGLGAAFFDDVDLSIIPVPQPGGTPNYDGFPAQALQAYNACKSHGFNDANILMMIDSGDQAVDINATDFIANDYQLYKNLYPGCYDYENANVTKANFTREMNVSNSGSWASKIGQKDNVLIYMIDHGAQTNSTEAVFCFPRSSNNITESEMKALLQNISCSRLALFVDCCYSGNFIDSLDASNRIQVAASANIPSWYWKMATVNHWAGSWYFHPFWEELNKSKTIAQANTTACNDIPWGQFKTVNAIQSPQVRDSSGLLSSWNPLL